MEGTPGKREIKRERDKERVSLLCFCCLFWFLTKKRGFSGLLKNLKSLSRIKFFFVSFRAARFAGKTVHPSMRTNARRPKSNSKRRLPRKTAGDASIAPSRARVVVDRRRDSSTHVPPCIQKKREERDKKKGRLKERTASVTTAVLFWGVGIARVDGDATLESPRAPREDKESAVKDWNNADIFLLTHDVRQWWSRALVRDFVFFCVDKSNDGILVASQKRKSEKGKKEPKMTNEFCLLELPLINSLYDYKK